MASPPEGDEHDPGKRPAAAWRGMFRGYRARLGDGDEIVQQIESAGEDDDIPSAQPTQAPQPTPGSLAEPQPSQFLANLTDEVAEHERMVAEIEDLRTIVAAWQHKENTGVTEGFRKACQQFVMDMTKWISVYEEIPLPGETQTRVIHHMLDFVACCQDHWAKITRTAGIDTRSLQDELPPAGQAAASSSQAGSASAVAAPAPFVSAGHSPDREFEEFGIDFTLTTFNFDDIFHDAEDEEDAAPLATAGGGTASARPKGRGKGKRQGKTASGKAKAKPAGKAKAAGKASAKASPKRRRATE